MMPEKSSDEVAALGTAPVMSVQTGRVGRAQVANVSLQSTASGQLMKQCSFLADDLIDSMKLSN